MNTTESIIQAQNLLGNATPLRTDCGKLCKKACCQPGEQTSGMILFPGEESLLMHEHSWLKLTPLDTNLTAHPLYLAHCTAPCSRHLRPLACRIFPLTPYLSENGILQIKIDPRAKQLCPLAQLYNKKDLDPRFVQAVRKASAILIKNTVIYEYIEGLSRMLDDYTNLPFYQMIDCNNK